MNRWHLKWFLIWLGFVAAIGLGHELRMHFDEIRQVLALTESTKTMPTDINFNAVGYSGANVTVGASQVAIARNSSWWDLNWNYKRNLNVKNVGSSDLEANATVQALVDISSMGLGTTKLQASFNDLRVIYTVGATFTEVPRTVNQQVGATNLVTVTFSLQAVIGAGATDAQYYMYYGNPSATDPGNKGYSLGSGVTATFTLPLSGSTAAYITGGTTGPSTATGPLRFSTTSALSFDGANDKVQLANNMIGSSGTIEMWVYPRVTPANTNFATQSRQSGDGNDGMTLGINPGYGNSVVFAVIDPTGGQHWINAIGATVSLNSWSHVVGTWAVGSPLKIFVNGVGYTSNASLLGAPVTAGNFRIAYSSEHNDYFNGMIDEVRVSNTVRYTDNFTPPTAPFDPDSNTTLLYHFDENGTDPRKAGVAVDASGNGNDGTISGAKYVAGYFSNQTLAAHSGVMLEEGTTNFIPNPSFENGTWNLNWSPLTISLNSGTTSFTVAMAKRKPATGPFAAGVIPQGKWGVGDTGGDTITVPGAVTIGSNFRTYLDQDQGSIVFWVTPEWNGNDGLNHVFFKGDWTTTAIYKETDNKLYFNFGWGYYQSVDVSNWTAGSTYLVTARWDKKNTLDGTNYISLSIGDTHTYGSTSLGGASWPNEIMIGGGGGFGVADALIQGLTIYRRPLWDGQYGINVGNGDEINQIYASGSGKDPTQVTGSWDVVFAMPTDAQTGSLPSGVGVTGLAWTHPHTSSLLGGANGSNGFMMNGTFTSDSFTQEVPSYYEAYGTGTTVFTPNMAKRKAPTGPFAASILAQGKTDGGTGTDSVTYDNGSTLGTGFKQMIDANQGTISVWVTPEWNGNDGLAHYIWDPEGDNHLALFKNTDNTMTFMMFSSGYSNSTSLAVDVSSWVAGTTHLVVVSWDSKNQIDNSGHNIRMTIDNVSTFGGNTMGSVQSPGNMAFIGTRESTNGPANALLQGLTIYRRVLFTGVGTTSGVDVGNGDEINQIYNSGSGRDPTLVTGSWDVVFAAPTDGAVGSLGVGGTTLAWSYPYSSNLLGNGGYMLAGNYATDGWELLGGTAAVIPANQKIFSGGYAITGAAATGIGKTFTIMGGTDVVVRVLVHGDSGCAPRVIMHDTVTYGDNYITLSGDTNPEAPQLGMFSYEIGGTSPRVMELELINASGGGSGTCYWHQAEILPNLFPNSSLETGSTATGNWIPTGYTNNNIGASNVAVRDTSVRHSGSSSLKFANTSNVGINGPAITTTQGKFYGVGFWGIGDGNYGSRLSSVGGGYELENQAGAAFSSFSTNDAKPVTWAHRAGVGRSRGLSFTMNLGSMQTDTADSWIDDVYLYNLQDVSLTVTPATQASSMETNGLRVDGGDVHTETISNITTAQGVLKFNFTPRHNFGIASSFGVVNPVIVDAYAGSNNYIKLQKQDATTMQLVTVANGTTTSIGWTNPTLNSGTSYPIEIGYSGSANLYFKVNNVTVGTTNTMGTFSTAPMTIYWGTDNGGANSNPYDGDYQTPSGVQTVAALATSEKIYNSGYKTTTSLANAGLGITMALTGGTDVVARVVVNSDGTCQPKAILSVGATDFAYITGNTNTGRTAPDNLIFTGEVPGSGAQTVKLKLISTAGSGTCYWHQAEVLTNRVRSPSLESGSGDPWLPTGWASTNIPAGDVSADTGTVHSGAQSMKLSIGDTGVVENLRVNAVGSNKGEFVSFGAFMNETSGQLELMDDNGFKVQSTPDVNSIGPVFHVTAPGWKLYSAVFRTGQYGKNPSFGKYLDNGTGYVDDVYAVGLSAVSLTVTPATQANSQESTGLRIDGADNFSETIAPTNNANVDYKFTFTPRHDFSVADNFGSTAPVIAYLYGDNNDYVKVFRFDDSRIRITGAYSGAAVSADWMSPTLNAGTTYAMEMSSVAGGSIKLIVNGVQVASATGAGAFAAAHPPTTAYLGWDGTTNYYDMTINSVTGLTASQNTNSAYVKYGSNSAAADNSLGSVDDDYVTYLNVGDTQTYDLSAYVYNNTTNSVGSTVDGTVAVLSAGTSNVATSYTDEGGGWWRLSGTTTGIGNTAPYGVRVKAGKKVFADGVQLEQIGYPTSYGDGSLGSGYSWLGTANNSRSVRTVNLVQYDNNSYVTAAQGSVSFWMKPNNNFWDYTSWNNSTQMLFNVGVPWAGSPDGTALSHYGSNLDFGSVQAVPKVLGQWVHVVFGWDGTLGYLYVNGVGSSGAKTVTTMGTNLLTIGDGFENVDDVRVFNQKISGNQVADLYNAGLATHTAGSEGTDKYYATGSYTSPVIDLSANGGWGVTPLVWTSNVGNSGAIAWQTRSSADNVTWSNWVSQTGTSIASDPRRYFQWKADLTAGMGQASTPTISGMVVSYVQDTNKPTNPTDTALGYSAGIGTTALTSNSWYNYTSPTFVWGSGVDTALPGQSVSGVAKYIVLITTDAGATPVDNSGDPCYGEKTDADRSLSCTISSNNSYYLRLQTEDNSGNIADPVTLFVYKFDKDIPVAPSTVSSTTIGYSATNSYTFFWPAASDVGPAGVKGYQYKTGSTAPPFNDWQFTDQTSISGVTAYTQGQNVFYVRTMDNAGNVSPVVSNAGTASFYYNSTAPTAPLNLVITPITSSTSPATTNKFTVTWDKPTSYSGDIAKYYYCVNCTPSSTTMTQMTAAQTANRTLTDVALATQQGKNTLYVVAEDNNVNSTTAEGNVNWDAYASADFYASTVVPAAPINLTITDASDRSSSKWRLTLAWDVGNSTPVDHFDLYRSTDNTTFTKIGSATGTAYTDASLTQSTLYYYKVKALDNAGSASAYSATMSKAPQGKYSTPPSVSSTPSVTTGASTATITWTTDRTTFGTVEYGKTTDYGLSSAESTSTTSHSVKVTGLMPGQTYHYRIQSMDDSGLVDYLRTAAYSSDYSFTTLSTPTISDVNVTDESLDSAVINWTTTNMATSTIEYGLTTTYGTSVSVSIGSGAGTHSAKLSSLKNSSTYHFRIRGTDVDGNDLVSDDYTFQTIIFPQITAYVLKTDQDAGGTVINVAWASNVPISSEVDYQAANTDKFTTEELSQMNQV